VRKFLIGHINLIYKHFGQILAITSNNKK